MRTRRMFFGFFVGVCALVVSLIGIAPAHSDQATHLEVSELRVALFPYVPDLARMREVISRHWVQRHPNVRLKFVDWDGYVDDPPADLDVFEYDAIFLEHMARNNFASPLQIDDVNASGDIMDFALRGSMVDGHVYGIPHLACTPVLFYRDGDRAIAEAKSISDLHRIIGKRAEERTRPSKGEGVLIDLSGGTTCACFYIDALADLTGNYWPSLSLGGPAELNDDAIDNVQRLGQMAGRSQALFQNYDGQRARWFGEGYGRGFIGWTERLYFIPKKAHSEIRVRTLPLADTNAVNLLFVDVFSVSPTITGRRRELALEFANLAASSAVVLEVLLPAEEEASSAYLLPVRKSVLENKQLLTIAPLYQQLREIYGDKPRAFRIGVESRRWLDEVKGEIRRRVTIE